MNNVAVIGGSGFIGYQLTEEMKRRGYNVCVIDKAVPRNDVRFIQGDVTDPDFLNKTLHGFDGVFHLAAMVGVDSCLADSDSVYQTNLKGTENVVNACKLNNIKRFFFTSSSEVYGDGVKVPFSEDDEKLPKSTYGKTKVAAEEYLRKVASEDFIVRVVRYFNIYGVEQRNDFVMKRFIERALSNDEITIYGDGNQIRCFTHVRDGVRGSLDVYEYNGNHFEVFNIANSSNPIQNFY